MYFIRKKHYRLMANKNGLSTFKFIIAWNLTDSTGWRADLLTINEAIDWSN